MRVPIASSGDACPGGHAGTPDVAGVGEPATAPDAAAARCILGLLREDDVDAAIEAGLAHFAPLDALEATDNDTLTHARDRLLAAWAARDRHRARGTRLERIVEVRRRALSTRMLPGVAGTDADEASADAAVVDHAAPAPSSPTLPASAAAALARARARASAGKP